MTIRYVGSGGSDANSGLSWALRKLTLNGAEDSPVVAGDTVYIGPGTYRELLTLDVSGSSGNPITYIADVTGANTDGVGGAVRVTGSDNDQTATRANCVNAAAARIYRNFRGFQFDMTTGILLNAASNSGNWIVEDCILCCQSASSSAISFTGTGTACTVRRCLFYALKANGIVFTHTSTVSNAGHVVENCIVFGIQGRAVSSDRVGGITVRNLLVWGASNAVRVGTALAAGQTIAVNNCAFFGNITTLQATIAGEIVENYNSFFASGTDRTLTNTGANSDTLPTPLDLGILYATIALVVRAFSPAVWSPLKAITGTGDSTDDLYGITKPVTAGKMSRGPVQWADISRDVATVRTGSASIKLADAARHQMFVPVTQVSTTFSVYVRREANYAGTSPQMIIKQPGQSDVTVTDAGSSGSWNQLTTSLTPAATPGYVVVELVSNNTASAGSYNTYFDDLQVS